MVAAFCQSSTTKNNPFCAREVIRLRVLFISLLPISAAWLPHSHEFSLPMIQDEIIHAVTRLESWCGHNQIPWNDSATDRFIKYIHFILYYQKQTNLTGFSSPDELVNSLIIDSLQILRSGSLGNRILDIGSGAGFPAIPVKIIHPDISMVLVEPRTKRYAFLRKIESELGLEHLSIERCKIQSLILPHDLDCVMSKAFMAVREWLNLTRPWAEQGAKIVCFLSKKDYIENKTFISSLGYTIHSLTEEGDRIYLILKSIQSDG